MWDRLLSASLPRSHHHCESEARQSGLPTRRRRLQEPRQATGKREWVLRARWKETGARCQVSKARTWSAIDRVAPAGVTRVAIARPVFFVCCQTSGFLSICSGRLCCMVHMPRRKAKGDTYWTPPWWYYKRGLPPLRLVARNFSGCYGRPPRPSPPTLKS